uniref:Lipoprotein n=1 Tax=Rhodopseudomonas palustris (strain BisA53) TaxID=316055 RepID=Q07I57_RHOP5
MSSTVPTRLMLAMLAMLALSACASRHDVPASAGLTEDDDTFCRQGGVAVGSNDYVNCRKNRDVQRSNALTRANKAQRNLGEMMLNNPDRPQ